MAYFIRQISKNQTVKKYCARRKTHCLSKKILKLVMKEKWPDFKECAKIHMALRLR